MKNNKVPSQRAFLEEAALILEQEGWLVSRHSREEPRSRRWGDFATRYEAWKARVEMYRGAHPGKWPEPPDNS